MEERSRKGEVVLVLHNIRSVYNVGALFRTADAVGVGRILLSGYTPAPVDRFGRIRADFAKSALGAERSVPWEYRKSSFSRIRGWKRVGYQVVGVEQDARSVDYKRVKKAGRMVLIAGTETAGMSPALRSLCDTLAEIPMRGAKESLNVAVAMGIVLYRVLDRR